MDIYVIKILKWSEYNPKHQKRFKSLLIPNNFANDAKLSALPVSHRWMWLALLLTCSDHASDTVELSERQLRVMLESSKSIVRALDDMQSFQLLTYEKKHSLIKESKRKESKVKEKKGSEIAKVQKQPVSDKPRPQELIALYCDCWKELYRTEQSPIISKSHAGMILNLMKSAGQDRSKEIIKNYFQMPDKWFITKRHDIPTMITNTNAIVHFIETGRLISQRELSVLDKQISSQNLINDIKENGI